MNKRAILKVVFFFTDIIEYLCLVLFVIWLTQKTFNYLVHPYLFDKYATSSPSNNGITITVIIYFAILRVWSFNDDEDFDDEI